ncbi:unnamed protein product [Phytophthora fragariaefolia]|uniref:Unnamed protein product n=1 Tax=Phytophthora fragariaefolia TaxID=1490495 RepID=A0A9W6XIS2_9STRA|nr:unnamed protein product [Phytophthora fragariaefolia]
MTLLRSPPSTPKDEQDDSASEAPFVPSPIQNDDIFETPKAKKEKAKSAKITQPEPEAEIDVWTAEQLEALMDAKLMIPTTASNFWAQYEKKHVDDLFETTPSKEGLPELPEFDSLKSPDLATPSHSHDEDESDIDDEAPRLLKKLSSRRRDDIDSYVLGINRQHVAGGGVMTGGKVRRVTSMITPVKNAKANAVSTKVRRYGD